MRPDQARVVIDSTLREQGFLLTTGICPTYTGQISVHGSPVDVRLEIPDARFVNRPRVHLINRDQIPLDVLAHIEIETGICYASAAGLPFDNAKPGEAILRVLREAEKTLERSYRGQGAAEMADEYQHYWKGLAILSLLGSTLEPGTHEAFLCSASRDDAKAVLLSRSATINGWPVEDEVLSALVFSTRGRIGPGKSIVPPTDLPSLEAWWAEQAALSDIPWNTVEKALLNRKIGFIFSANALVGFSIKRPPKIRAGLKSGTIRLSAVPKLLAAMKGSLELERWNVVDASLERITSRNAIYPARLAECRIALIGCGTIGSHLARTLIQSGAGLGEPFYLFDTDKVSPGNLGRHLLNFADIGKNKAEALARELQRFHPDVSVLPFAADAVQSWSSLKGCDLIIDATGDWNVQTALNELFLEDRGTKLGALLHSWVFGNGVGAQSFLNLGDDKACFRCLRPDFAGQWRYPAAQNGIVTQFMPASCGDGTYAAFSVDAPVIAASLSLRSAIDWSRGEPGARLRTVAVDPIGGRHQPPKSPEPVAGCPACASFRETA